VRAAIIAGAIALGVLVIALAVRARRKVATGARAPMTAGTAGAAVASATKRPKTVRAVVGWRTCGAGGCIGSGRERPTHAIVETDEGRFTVPIAGDPGLERAADARQLSLTRLAA
jgi:hypothetical protein